MRRSAKATLFIVVMLSVASSAWLAMRGMRDTPPSGPLREARTPDMRIQNAHLVEQAENGDTWELVAQEAEFYDTEHLVVVHQLRARLLSQDEQPIDIVAKHGRIDSVTGNITVHGDVQLRYLGVYTIATEVLHWDATNRIVHTDAAVTIDSSVVHIAGVGLLGHVVLQRFVLQGEVHAGFQAQ